MQANHLALALYVLRGSLFVASLIVVGISAAFISAGPAEGLSIIALPISIIGMGTAVVGYLSIARFAAQIKRWMIITLDVLVMLAYGILGGVSILVKVSTDASSANGFAQWDAASARAECAASQDRWNDITPAERGREYVNCQKIGAMSAFLLIGFVVCIACLALGPRLQKQKGRETDLKLNVLTT